MIGTYLVHGWRHLLVVIVDTWFMDDVAYLYWYILLEAHIDLGDDYELLCYDWLMHIFESCLGD
jgi:hypothetical protein